VSKKISRLFLFTLALLFISQKGCLAAEQGQRGLWQRFQGYAPSMIGGAGLGGALGYSVGPQLGYNHRLTTMIGLLLGGALGVRFAEAIRLRAAEIEAAVSQGPSYLLERGFAEMAPAEPEAARLPGQAENEAKKEINQINKNGIWAGIARNRIGFNTEKKVLSFDKNKITVRAFMYDFFYNDDFQNKSLSIAKRVGDYENQLIDENIIKIFNHVLIYALITEGRFTLPIKASFEYKSKESKTTFVIKPDIEDAKTYFLLDFFHAYKKPDAENNETVRMQILDDTKTIREKADIVLKHLKDNNKFDNPTIFTFN